VILIETKFINYKCFPMGCPPPGSSIRSTRQRASNITGHGRGAGFRVRVQGQGPGSGFRVRVQGQGPGSGFRVRVQGQGAGSGFRVRVQGQGAGFTLVKVDGASGQTVERF